MATRSGSTIDHGSGLYSQAVSQVGDDGQVVSAGNTQYTEGDTSATLKTTVMGFEADTGTNTVRPVNQTYPLPVQQAALSPSVDQVSVGAATTGGWTPGKLVSAASTNATSVKASAGQIGYIYATNVNAAIRYLKLYDKASSPTVGTDTPVATIGIPGGSTAGAGGQLAIPAGMVFSVGIAFALTTEATDAGTTAVAANEIVISYGWK